jgi:hypothetical protein
VRKTAKEVATEYREYKARNTIYAIEVIEKLEDNWASQWENGQADQDETDSQVSVLDISAAQYDSGGEDAAAQGHLPGTALSLRTTEKVDPLQEVQEVVGRNGGGGRPAHARIKDWVDGAGERANAYQPPDTISGWRPKQEQEEYDKTARRGRGSRVGATGGRDAAKFNNKAEYDQGKYDQAKYNQGKEHGYNKKKDEHRK